MRKIVTLFALLFALLTSAVTALADKRVALLIGNSGYAAVPALANPRNDVKLLKSALEAAGFDEVRVAFDLGQKPMLKALNAFADAAADADIAVIYYSGHGLEMGGVNYLVPVDAALATDTDVSDETVTLERAMQAIDGAKRLKLVILDACRTNPFLASIKIRSGRKAIEKGLAPVEPAGSDTLVAFAAKAGTPAYDGDGENSPFAAALAKRLVAPGDDVEIALRKVRDDVLAATHNRQEPFKYGSLGGSVIPLSKITPAAQPDAVGAETAYDAAMGAGTVEALDAFLAKYPEGGLAKSARRERERLAKLAAIVPKPISAPAAAEYKFVVVPKAMNNPFFDLARDGCLAEAKKLGGIKCIYKGPIAHEPANQAQIIQDFITQKVDGLAISVSDTASMLNSIAAAKAMGIPAITFDTDAPGSERISYLGTEDRLLGLALGKMLLKLRPEGGKYAMVSGVPGAAALAERVDAVREALKDSKWVEVSGSPIFCNDNPVLANQQMDDLHTATPELAAIISLGGWPMFVPEAYQKFATKYKKDLDAGKFTLIVAGTLPVQVKFLKDGLVNALVGQRPYEMGEKAMDTLLAIKKGEKVPDVIHTGLDLVTKANVDTFMK